MDITPILSPFIALLKSRAFILSIVTAVVAAIVIAVPSLEPMQDELINVIVGLALALIGKMAIEDGAEKFGASQAQPQVWIEDTATPNTTPQKATGGTKISQEGVDTRW